MGDDYGRGLAIGDSARTRLSSLCVKESATFDGTNYAETWAQRTMTSRKLVHILR